jgi:aromatic-L-amino-acid/L-tryptophan decarboxylase
MTPEEFRAAGHQIVDWIADYRATVASRPVMARTGPGDVKRQLPAQPPEQPEPFASIVRDLDAIILPGLSHWQHPQFFGYFPCNGTLASVPGDYVSTGLGVLGLAWQASPALTELEEVVTDWMRGMLGLSESWSGVIQDTASTSTMIALMCARERTTAYGSNRGGLQSEPQPLVVYTSAHSHSSVDKAALMAGFGRANIRSVPHDERYAMRSDALAAAITADLRAGLKPCAIVATSGSTASTALDPIEAIATLARQHGLWLHVDAAMAGSAMVLPECRWMWMGVEGADSVVVNPHKWLGAAFDCTLYYVRDAEHLVRVMSTNPSYLQSSADGRVKNLRDWGIPLGRRFRALKLWFLIREQGVSGLQAAARSGQRTMAGGGCPVRAELASARAGAAADGLCAAPARRSRGRVARSPHPSLVRSREPIRRRLSDTGNSGWPLDRAGLDWRRTDRTVARRDPVADHASGGRTMTPDGLSGRRYRRE